LSAYPFPVNLEIVLEPDSDRSQGFQVFGHSDNLSRKVDPGPFDTGRSEARINVTSQSGWTSKEGNEQRRYRNAAGPAASAAYLNQAMHTKPPIARFANGECFSGGSVIAAVRRT
jgi:hypothetical protein